MRIPAAVLLLGVCIAFGDGVSAQSDGCASCVTFTPVVELSTEDAPMVPSTVQSVLRIGDARHVD